MQSVLGLSGLPPTVKGISAVADVRVTSA